jgi:hypothetical protein
MRASQRKLLILLGALLVVAALLYRSRGAVSLEGFDWRRLGAVVRGARLSLLLLSFVAIYACYWFRAWRWTRLTLHVGYAGTWSVFQDTVMGFTSIFLLGRAGEPVRPLLIARRERLPAASMFGIYVVERVFDVAVTVALTGLGLVFLPDLLRERAAGAHAALGSSPSYLPLMQKAGFFFLLGLLAAIVLLAYLRATEGGWLARLTHGWKGEPGWHGLAAGIVAGFLEGLQALRTWGDLGMGLVLTTAHWLLVLLIYYWVPLSLGGGLADFDLRRAVLTLACTLLGSALQLPGVGGGSQAGSFVALTLFLGIAKEPAAAASLLLWLITFCGCAVAGIPLLLREGLSLGELRRIAKRSAEKPATLGEPAGGNSGKRKGR